MRWIFSTYLLSALLLSSAFSDHHHGPEHSQPEEVLSAPNADFAFALYKNLRAKTPAGKNIFFSPLGISTALSMVSAGAGGETHSQLFSTLGYSAFNQTQVNEAYKHLFDMLGHNEESLQLDVGNAAAVRSGFSPSETFLTVVKEFYNGEVFNVNTNLSEAAAEINRFIANKTRNKITDMVKDLDPDMAMVLINSVYFNGKWVTPFDSYWTREADFHVDNATDVKVDMMRRREDYKVFWDEANHATLVMLPYKGNVSMMIVLPDEDKMESVENYINANTFKHWQNSLSKWEIILKVPKFSISADASLTSTLKEMGIENAFEDNADFSGISEEIKLKISKVSHKTALSVNEMGTEATAVYLSGFQIVSAPPFIIINRPFLVFILDDITRCILFMGKISDPTAK